MVHHSFYYFMHIKFEIVVVREEEEEEEESILVLEVLESCYFRKIKLEFDYFMEEEFTG